jgi:flagellar basal body rod protein FlgG
MHALLLAVLSLSNVMDDSAFIPVNRKEGLTFTGKQFDLAIEGEGYFQFRLWSGETCYTRNGRFTLNDNGMIETASHCQLWPQSTIPPTALATVIEPNGKISCLLPGQTSLSHIGQITICRFRNPSDDSKTGWPSDLEPNRLGEPLICEPGGNGAGKLRQGFLNKSLFDLPEGRRGPLFAKCVPPYFEIDDDGYFRVFTPYADRLSMRQRGHVVATDGSYDVAIEGKGYLQVVTPSGETLYTRRGRFSLNPDRKLVTAEGYVLDPCCAIPSNAASTGIGTDGTVSMVIEGVTTRTQIICQIMLIRFPDPSGLEKVGTHYLKATRASGGPIKCVGGCNGVGKLQQGFLEITPSAQPYPEWLLARTDDCFDLGIAGQGFFAVETPCGEPLFTRLGRFRLASSGRLLTHEGYRVAPDITFPPKTESVAIDLDGTVRARTADSDKPVVVGKLALRRFRNPLALSKAAPYYFKECAESGAPTECPLGAHRDDKVWQGFLELQP